MRLGNLSSESDGARDHVVELVDDNPFFAPAATDLVDGLVGQYLSLRTRIENMASVVNGEAYAGALHHFISGNKAEGRRVSPERIFELPGAIASLNATYWSKALALTDVLDTMPQKRRDEWNRSISEMTAPDFEDASVRTTLTELLGMRSQFLAERVDGIFRVLSSDHVTNVPEGFAKRMIVAYVVNDWGSPDSSRCGYINDLRAVVAKFMGRDEPPFNATFSVIRTAREQPGDWLMIDGGALRVRVYLKGTAHLEVHPDMAWRLNSVLSQLYPRAIPAQFRTKQKKAAKAFALMVRPLPFAVLAVLAQRTQVRKASADRGADRSVANACALPHSGHSKTALSEAAHVMESIGGVLVGGHFGHYQFDYDPADVLTEIAASGCIPDQKTHQYYPTPAAVAAIVVEMAEIGEANTVLEPSAGQGGLAAFLPKDRTTCVEISPLHCEILRAKGFATEQADFLNWRGGFFDRIVMNPPFSEGRWRAHIEHAYSLLSPGGRLVAVLPASAVGKAIVPEKSHWSPVIDNAFAGTSASVTVMSVVKVCA